MDRQILHSLVFMDNLKRLKTIQGMEDFQEYVSEGAVQFHTENGTESIIYERDEMLKLFTDLADPNDKQERLYLRNIGMRVLKENADLEAVSEAYKNVVRISPAKLNGLVEVLFKVEEYRNEANKDNRDHTYYGHKTVLDMTKLFCDRADLIIQYMLQEKKDMVDFGRLVDKYFMGIRVSRPKYTEYIINFKTMEILAVARDKEADCPEYIKCIKHCQTEGVSVEQSLIELSGLLTGLGADARITKSLSNRKNELESQIDIILADYGINGPCTNIPMSITDSTRHDIIPTIMHHLRTHENALGRVHSHLVCGKPFTYEITYLDLFKLKNAYPKWHFETCCYDAGNCTLATDYLNLYLLFKDTETNDVIAVHLVRNCVMTRELEVLLGSDEEPMSSINVTRIKFREGKTVSLDQVKEGIVFTEDGGLKLTYKRGTTFMDDYSKMNRILVQNARNENTEAMKHDLVYLFAFIDELESLINRKEKLKESVREDAMKARMFAKGDFKQYLAIVQQADPTFNFAKYYEDNYVNNGKVLVEFSNAEVRGFKKLLRTIIG